MRLRHLIVAAVLIGLPGCGGGGGGGYTVPINLTPSSASLYPNATDQFIATIPNVASPRIVWSVQEGSSGGSITQTGLYTAPALAGTYHVVASGPLYNNAQSTATVVVHVKVNLTPKVVTTSISLPVQFTATVLGTTNNAVTWSIQEGSAGGTITSSGLYTAPTTPGIYHIVATSVIEPAQHDTATVGVGYGSASGNIQ